MTDDLLQRITLLEEEVQFRIEQIARLQAAHRYNVERTDELFDRVRYIESLVGQIVPRNMNV